MQTLLISRRKDNTSNPFQPLIPIIWQTLKYYIVLIPSF